MNYELISQMYQCRVILKSFSNFHAYLYLFALSILYKASHTFASEKMKSMTISLFFLTVSIMLTTAKPILMSHSRLRDVDEDPVESEDKVGMKKLLSAWTWIKNLQQSIIEDE